MLLKMNKSRLSLQTDKIQEHNRNLRMIKQLYFAQGPEYDK